MVVGAIPARVAFFCYGNQSTRSVLRIQRKEETDLSEWGTKCLSSRFLRNLLLPTLQCAGYTVKIKSVANTIPIKSNLQEF